MLELVVKKETDVNRSSLDSLRTLTQIKTRYLSLEAVILTIKQLDQQLIEIQVK
jgi:hypothetical protein